MADLARLVVRLEAESLKFQKELDQSKRKLTRFEKAANKSTKNIGRAVKASGAAIGVGAIAAAAGFALMIRSQRNVIDSQAKLAQQLDTTVASVANLERAGELGGVALGKIDAASRRLNVSIGKAIEGTGLEAEAFDRLGVSAKALFEIPLDQRLAKINAALNDNVTAAERASVASDIFGTRNAAAIRQLQPEVIAEGARQVKLFGLALTDIDAKKVETANDAMGTFALLAKGVKTQITVQLAPVLQKLGQQFLDAAEKAGGLGNQVRNAVSDIVGFAQVVLNIGAVIGRTFSTMANSIVALVASNLAALNAFASGVHSVFALLPDALGGDKFQKNAEEFAAAARMNADVAGQALDKIRENLTKPLAGNAVADWFKDAQNSADASAAAAVKATAALRKTGEGAGEIDTKAAAAAESLAGMVDQLNMQMATADMTAGATLRYRLSVGDLSKDIALGGAAAERYGETLAQLSFELDDNAEAQAAAAKSASEQASAMARGVSLATSLQTPLETLRATYADLNDLQARGAITQETYNRAVAAAQVAFDEASEGANQFGIDMEEIGRTLGQNLQNSLADFLFDPFADGTKSMREQFSDLLKRMAADVASAAIMEGIFGGEGVGSGGGLLGKAASLAGSFFGGAKANGGPVQSGGAFLVGERGPEVFVPGSSGTVVDARDTARMGGGSVTVNVSTPDADSFRASRRQISRVIKQGVAV